MQTTSLTDYERLAPDLSYADLLEAAQLQGYRIDKMADPTEEYRQDISAIDAVSVAAIDAGLILLVPTDAATDLTEGDLITDTCDLSPTIGIGHADYIELRAILATQLAGLTERLARLDDDAARAGWLRVEED